MLCGGLTEHFKAKWPTVANLKPRPLLMRERSSPRQDLQGLRARGFLHMDIKYLLQMPDERERRNLFGSMGASQDKARNST